MVGIEEDGILIKKIQSGDKKSQKNLYKKYKKIVKKFIIRKYPFNRDTDDDVSEIMIRLFESLDNFDIKKSKFFTWVINITKNFMIDKSRTGAFYLHNNTSSYIANDCGGITLINDNGYNNNVLFSSKLTSYDTPDLKLENNDSLNFIENNVGVKDFHLLSMKYTEGYDYKEMETEMRTSSSTLSNRVNYVKSKIKKNK